LRLSYSQSDAAALKSRSSNVMLILATRTVEAGSSGWLGWDYENAGNFTAG
jgi:hypothetical protein